MAPKKEIKKKTEKKENPDSPQIQDETAEKAEIIARKKIVYAEIDDEVTALYDKIKAVKTKHVYIVVPRRAIIFQSVVNLKILKRKASDDDKTIYLISNDQNGVYLAQQLGIPVYNKENNEGKPAIFSTDAGDEKLRITPLRASVNSVEEEAPTRLKERKLSISEILSRRGKKKTLDVSKIDGAAKEKEKKKAKSKFVVVAPNRHALIGLTVVTVFVLLVIVYIALPGVTIYLTPSASVLEKSVNITLANYTQNAYELETRPPHMIASYPIETTVSKSITHYATGKKFSDNGANASGKILISNTTDTAWPLIPETRFQTDDGIVFRISNAITVPAATSDGPGTAEAFVTADQTDTYGVIVGERGNIEPSRFFLPGLKESSRSKIYAENSEPMTGGVTDFIAYISEEDIEAAKLRINDELLRDAVSELEIAVVNQGDLIGNVDAFTLLDGDDAIKISDVSVDIPSGLVGQNISEFTVSGEVSVSGVYYDHEAMLDILRDELSLKKSPQKELLRINEESTSYRIFEWDDRAGKIKLTANIKGIEQFSIDPDKENGARLLSKIREHIVGKDIEEAKLYIQNLPEVNKVEIDSWPAWAPTIPNISDNINFEIREAIKVE